MGAATDKAFEQIHGIIKKILLSRNRLSYSEISNYMIHPAIPDLLLMSLSDGDSNTRQIRSRLLTLSRNPIADDKTLYTCVIIHFYLSRYL